MGDILAQLSTLATDLFSGDLSDLCQRLQGSCMVFSGSLANFHGHKTQLRHWQPRQQLLIPFDSLCSFLLTLRFCHEFVYLTSVRWGLKHRWRFLWVEVMTLWIKSGNGRSPGGKETVTHSDPSLCYTRSRAFPMEHSEVQNSPFVLL